MLPGVGTPVKLDGVGGLEKDPGELKPVQEAGRLEGPLLKLGFGQEPGRVGPNGPPCTAEGEWANSGVQGPLGPKDGCPVDGCGWLGVLRRRSSK